MNCKFLMCLVGLALLSPMAASQTLDADITLGSSFTGRLDDGSDVDVLRFSTIKNTQVTLSVAGKKDKLNKGSPVLLPQLEVLDVSTGGSLAFEDSGKKKSAVKKLLLPSTGEYLIRVSSAGGTSGPYKVTTKGALSKAGKVHKVSAETGAGATSSVSFDADAGFLLNALVKPDKKSLSQPGVPTLTGPSGAIDLTGLVVTNTKKFSHKLKKFPLTEQGTYTLSSTNDAADAGGIFTNVKLKPAKLPKQKLEETVDMGGGVSIVRTLSGVVQNSNDGSGLPGVLVLAGDMTMAVTDANGLFIVHDPPAGEVEVHFDGSGTTAMGDFEELGVLVTVAAVGDTVLQPVVLPDLSNPESAVDDVAVMAGVTTEDLAAMGGNENIQLSALAGTTILLDGVPASGTVAFNVTPVDPTQVPMPLVPASGAVDAASYVTIQPPNGTFDNGSEGAGSGLDVVLPNDRGFPVGTMVDIWSFDHDAGDWVNRSTETGEQGEVVATMSGTQIVASGVITAGGWHAPVVPVDPTCATKIIGRVLDGDGQPIPGAALGTATGQFAMTGADGSFCIDSVTAYDVASLPTCVLQDVLVSALTPVSFGAVGAEVLVLAGGITAGGVTDIGDIEIRVPQTGSLAGLLTDNGMPVMGAVDIFSVIEGVSQLMSNQNGSFFGTGLDAGDYTASFLFDGDAMPTSVPFNISANTLTTINLQKVSGSGGSESVTILVVEFEENSGNPGAVVQGAQVLLVGTDVSSQAGLSGTTDANGEVTFDNVDGPFTVTAQIDRILDFGEGPVSARFAHSVVDIDPPSGVIGIISDFGVDDDTPTINSEITGTVTDLMQAVGQNDFLSVQAIGTSDFQNFGNVDLQTGTYSLPVPAGDDYIIVFNHATIVGNNENRINSAQIVEGVDAPLNGSVAVDFEVSSAAAIAFDQEVDVNYSGLLANPCQQSLQVFFFTPNAEDYNLGTMVFTTGGLPGTVFVPDASDPNLGGFRVSLSLFQSPCAGEDDEVICDVFLDGNPASIDLDLLPIPTFVSPMQDDVINPNGADMMTVEFDGVAGQGSNGIVSLELITEGPQAGVTPDVIIWTFLLREGTTSVQLPPTVLPMIGDGAFWEACIESELFSGFVFDYDAIFNEDIADIDMLIDGMATGFCENAAIIEFSID